MTLDAGTVTRPASHGYTELDELLVAVVPATTGRRWSSDVVAFIVLSVIIFGLQHAKAIFSDNYSFKRRSVEIAVIAAVVGAVVVLVELLW